MQRPFSYTFAALTLLASAAVPAAEEVTINTPNGRPFVVLRVFDIGESTDKWGEPVTASAVLTDRERQLITSGLEYWGSLLEDGLQNTSPAVIDLIATKTDPDDINASATSLPTGVDDNTLLSALITENNFSASAGDSHAVITIDSPRNPGGDWASGSLHLLSQDGGAINLTATLVHEMAHALGIGSFNMSNATLSNTIVADGTGTEYTMISTRFDDSVTAWTEGLRDVDGDSAKAGMTISWEATGSHDEFNIPIDADGALNGASGIYFTGKHVSDVLDGAELSFPNNLSSVRVPGLPVVGWEITYLLDPENSSEDLYALFPELSHVELQNSLLSHQNWRNWSVPMEAELAVMQDLGFKLDRRNWFGYSIYHSGESETARRVFVNTNPYYARNESGDGWIWGEANDNAWGIGLHVYGSYNDVTQAADILTTGAYGIGIRLEGTGNVLRTDGDTLISADGVEGYGVLVSYGKDHFVEHKGTIQALGALGTAVRFDFGGNLLGNNIEERGSFIFNDRYCETEDERRAENERLGLDGALVKNFDVAGTLAGGLAAIYISDNAYVEQINFLQGAHLTGDILSYWNPEDESVVLPEDADPDSYLTTLNFGVKHADGDVTVDDYEADSAFAMHYEGRIFAGVDSETGDTQKASIVMNVCGGRLSFNGVADIKNVAVDNGAVLSGNALYKVDTYTNNGTLAPGNSIGRIYIQGDYVEGTDGRLALEFDGSGNTDRIVIEGTASKVDGKEALFTADIAPTESYFGTSVTVDFSQAVSTVQKNDDGTVSTTHESISIAKPGESQALQVASPTLSMNATYDADSQKLTVVTSRESDAYSRFAHTDEARKVAAAFDRHATEAKGGMRNLVAALDFSDADGSDLQSAYESLTPEVFSRVGAASLTAFRRVSDALLDGSSALAASGSADPDGTVAFAVPLGGYLQDGRLDMRSSYAGVLAGLQQSRHIDSGTLLLSGHVAAIKREDVFHGSDRSQLKAESFVAGAHLRYAPDALPGSNIFGLVQISIENADLDRGAAFGSWRDRASSDWTAWGGNLVFGAEMFFGIAPGLSVGPTARFDYAFMHRPDVTESSGNGSALYVHSETYQSLRSALGLLAHFELPYESAGVPELALTAAALWHHEFLPDAGDASASFVDWRDVTFAADDAEQARDTASLSVSLEGRLTESFSASLTAGAQFGGGVNGGWGSANLVWKF